MQNRSNIDHIYLEASQDAEVQALLRVRLAKAYPPINQLETACWIPKAKGNRASILWDGKNLSLPRLIYAMVHKQVPTRLTHTCNRNDCCNWWHLVSVPEGVRINGPDVPLWLSEEEENRVTAFQEPAENTQIEEALRQRYGK